MALGLQVNGNIPVYNVILERFIIVFKYSIRWQEPNVYLVL